MTTTENPMGWEYAAKQLGHDGMTATEAGRSKHLILLPMWEPICTCWREHEKYRQPQTVLADEHVRCHQRDCDLHEGAIARWLETRKKGTP